MLLVTITHGEARECNVVTAKQRAARALFARRAKAGFFRRGRAAGSRIRRRLRRRTRHVGGGIVVARRRRFSRARRFGGRIRRAGRRHPKLTTRLANGIGLLIAFNQEIDEGVKAFQQGSFVSNPSAALGGITYRATGYDPRNGNFNATQLGISAGSKIGGYVFAKIVKKLFKSMPVM